VIGKKWRELSSDEKQKYVDDYEIEKVKQETTTEINTYVDQTTYIEAMRQYQNSPAYQQYLVTKEKSK
jgi:hypothetical protein